MVMAGAGVSRRALLGGLGELGLACATTTDRIPPGALRDPPIDHVVVPATWSTRVASAWEGTTNDGVKLSDHSGLVVEVIESGGDDRGAAQTLHSSRGPVG